MGSPADNSNSSKRKRRPAGTPGDYYIIIIILQLHEYCSGFGEIINIVI